MSERSLFLVVNGNEQELAPIAEHLSTSTGIARGALQLLQDHERVIAYLNGNPPYNDRSRHPFPAVVLVDAGSIGHAGVELIRTIRLQPFSRKLPIVLMCTERCSELVRTAYDAGANSVLVKPADAQALAKTITVLHHYWIRLNQVPEI